ncbi:MAG TPA: PPC domain-containing DNA-binding protein [Actinomycetota bacterium]|nr:PPC domain-containing DNA-binding protein [Actinomycetota bacterium]
MHDLLLREDGERTYLLVFETGEKIVETLSGFARERGIRAARIQGIGAVSEAELGFFAPARKTYDRWTESEHEILSITGNLSVEGEEHKPHIHVVLGASDGTARGGHLLEGKVGPTLELFVVENPGREIQRERVEDRGLSLIRL